MYYLKKRKLNEEKPLALDNLLEKNATSLIDEGSDLSDKVKRDGNHIYFYCSVKTKTILELNNLIRLIERENLMFQIETTLVEPPKIYLHINSLGGSLFDAMSAIDTIIACKIPIVTIIEGCAASAATLMSVVASERIITPHSCMLIHQLSSGFWGKFNEIQDEVKNLKRLMKEIKKIYKEYTKLNIEKLDKCLNRDIWWSSKKCIRYGLVDKIQSDKFN